MPVRKFPFLILAAGRPVTEFCSDAIREAYSSVFAVDWIKNIIDEKAFDLRLVTGYQSEKFAQFSDVMTVCANDEWDESGSAWSLHTGLVEGAGKCVVSYGDVLFRGSLVDDLVGLDADVAIAVDSKWRDRFVGRSRGDLEAAEKVAISGGQITKIDSQISVDDASSEFIGLVCLGPRALRLLEGPLLKPFLFEASLAELLEWFRIRGLSFAFKDVQGDWAELNDPADFAGFVLGTKAESLSRLRPVLKSAIIEDQICFTVGEWRSSRTNLVEKIHRFSHEVVVRSSAQGEDSFGQSMAGQFHSELGVKTADAKVLKKSIDAVISSYQTDDENNQVLVQPMLNGVIASGVAFTRTLNQFSSYYVINYDDSTGSTESITAGSAIEDKTIVVRRGSSYASVPTLIQSLLVALQELESVLKVDFLDVEFAFTNDGLHVLQVRPMVNQQSLDLNELSLRDELVENSIISAKKNFKLWQQKRPGVVGDSTIFGIMPDWNPAEIIGTRPNLLAKSLYRYMLMDRTWAQQRAEFGYRDLSSHPLMRDFSGQPYIDVRASLNTFIPSEVPENVAAKIINFCIETLKNKPEWHDKVEFNLLPTCSSLSDDRWSEIFKKGAGLSQGEIDQWMTALQGITNSAFTRIDEYFDPLNKLSQRRKEVGSCKIPDLDRAILYLDDAVKLGALPFAHLARCGFIAITILRTAVAEGIIRQEEYDNFLRSINTISQEFSKDCYRCFVGKVSWNQLVEKYGHLRPGTYDITCASYRDNDGALLKSVLSSFSEHQSSSADPLKNASQPIEKPHNDVPERIANALRLKGMSVDGSVLENFLRKAVEGREYAKFIFTANLSSAIDCIKAWGARNGLEAADLAHISIDTLKEISIGTIEGSNIEKISHEARERSKSMLLAQSLTELPPLLTSVSEFDCFNHPPQHANFIGSKPICGELIEVNIEDLEQDLDGKLVLIASADPGYDWIFGKGILGLVTMYGGANSHMAIRAAELGLSSVIGVGEKKYNELQSANQIELDPKNRTLRIVS